jgi:hypothetical protein
MFRARTLFYCGICILCYPGNTDFCGVDLVASEIVMMYLVFIQKGPIYFFAEGFKIKFISM